VVGTEEVNAMKENPNRSWLAFVRSVKRTLRNRSVLKTLFLVGRIIVWLIEKVFG
jgi:hypothetical protein